MQRLPEALQQFRVRLPVLDECVRMEKKDTSRELIDTTARLRSDAAHGGLRLTRPHHALWSAR